MEILRKFLIIIAVLMISLSFSTFSIASNSNEEANKLIDTRKSENNSKNELNHGYGMKSLNRSPIPTFEHGGNGEVLVTIEDGKGFKSIKRKIGSQSKTYKDIKIDEKKGKIQTDSFPGPNEGKKKEVTYVITDSTGLKSTTKCIIYNKNGTFVFDTSMRVTFSYSNGNLHLILKDMGGITSDNASIEVFDYNTDNKKSVVKASGKNIQIDEDLQVEYPEKSGKIVYGAYSISLKKLSPDKNGKYYIRVKTTDCNKNVGYRMAKFEVDKNVDQEALTPAKASEQQAKETAKAEQEQKDANAQNNEGVTKKAKTYVAQIGDKKYEKLQTAINAVPKDNKTVTIKILKNISQNKGFTIAKGQNIVLDTGTYTITGTYSKYLKNVDTYDTFINKGTLHVKGPGTIYSKHNNAFVNYGTLQINGGKIIGSDCSTINNKKGATLKVSNGEIKAKGKGLAICNEKGATLMVTGGTIISEEGTAIKNYGTTSISGKAKLSSSSKEYPTIWNNKNATLKISGGEIKNTELHEGIKNEKGATLKVTGGAIISKDCNAIINSGTTSISGKAKISSSSKIYATIWNNKNATLKISGGKIKATGKNYAIYNKKGGTLKVTGGKIKSKNSYAIYNDGKASVKGAKISGKKYGI